MQEEKKYLPSIYLFSIPSGGKKGAGDWLQQSGVRGRVRPSQVITTFAES